MHRAGREGCGLLAERAGRAHADGMRHFIVVVGLVLLCSACGGTRVYGDPEADPVAFQVELERAFVSDMHQRGRARVGVGSSFGSGGYRGTGVGLGLHFSSTEVFLLGYDAASDALLFREELNWGTNTFAVPLLPQRELVLVADVRGSRQGSERIGRVAADQAQPISITLDERGSSLLRLDATRETVPAEDMSDREAAQETAAGESAEEPEGEDAAQEPGATD